MDEDEEVAEDALKALRKATQEALEKGHTIVVVQNNQLVRMNKHGIVEVLKDLPLRKKVTTRIKIAKKDD